MRQMTTRNFAARRMVLVALLLLAAGFGMAPREARAAGEYTAQEIVDAGHGFFGSTSGALASVIEKAFQNYGLPNGYILGQEGSGAFVAGLTYGEGQLNTKNAGQHDVFWQGPSLGIDYGGNGTRVMMLVYDLPSIEALFARYGGVSGSAYVVAGVGMTVLKSRNVVLVPIRTGVGARLGVNVGYLKLTRQPTWNPF
ncbi:MAG: EipA family protein [Rhizobium sp.]|nr:EipA family protein [Rhizobium sp.]MBW8322110.1 EipA family protein [Rhizobium sp.]MBW8447563.1 EipA family protein [Arenimonas sp.]